MMNLEQAKRVGLSEEWKIVVDELEHRIQGRINQLLNCHMDDLGANQLRIQVYEEIKRIPEDVKNREEQ